MTIEVKMPEYLENLVKEALLRIKKTSLEPPLTQSDFDPEILAKITPEKNDDDFYKTSIDTALKSILYFTTAENVEDGEKIIALGNLLDFAIVCTEMGIADSGISFNLLEDLFDTQTVPLCSRFFYHPESRVDRLRAIVDNSKNGSLVLLRTCNELLRRLSKAEDTIFCGRILIFLSKSFPIHEKSAVNLRGEFNTQNVTMFDDVQDDTPTNEDSMEIDDKGGENQEGRDKEAGLKPDDATKSTCGPSQEESAKVQKKRSQLSPNKLYSVFWSLQHDFADPTRLFTPDNFAKFKEALEATMMKFREADEESLKASGGMGRNEAALGPKKPEEKKLGGPFAGEKRKRDEEDHRENLSFNPKYLTSRELFELEVSDLTFRRNVLVQAMILLDFLLSLTPAAKEKWKELGPNPNKSVQYAFTLTPEDEQWVTKTKSQIISSLQPDQLGKLFVRLINTVLAREQNWVQWKAEGCQKFDMPPLEAEEIHQTKKKASNHCRPPLPFPHTMGTVTLSKIWRDTGNVLTIDDLVDEGRRGVPAVEEFCKGIEKDQEDLKDAMFPDDIQEVRNAIEKKTWKGLRLASQNRFYLFNKFDDKPDENRNDLQMLTELEEKVNEELRAKANQQVQTQQTQAQAQVPQEQPHPQPQPQPQP